MSKNSKTKLIIFTLSIQKNECSPTVFSGARLPRLLRLGKSALLISQALGEEALYFAIDLTKPVKWRLLTFSIAS